MVRTNAPTLFFGDIVAFVSALFVALALRYREIPSNEIVAEHLQAFVGIFVLWVVVFLIAGLYDTQVSLSRKRIPELVLQSQFANMLIAALVFFIFSVGITPKITLVLYLIVSSIFVIVWRLFLFPILATQKSIRALIIGSGEEAEKLTEIFNGALYYRFIQAIHVDPERYVNRLSLEQALLSEIDRLNISMVIGDMRSTASPLIPLYYDLTFLHRAIDFVSLDQLYEQVFFRVPPSLVEVPWILENVTRSPHYIHDHAKRAMDILGATALGLALLPLFPFIMLAIKWEDGGPAFYRTERVGRLNVPIHIIKFRTMNGQDVGQDALRSSLVVTRVGRFLRTTRLDELPQLWNVLIGDLSFIGPRPEMPALAKMYAERIPYYNMRHLIKPGLSGWAQIYHKEHPHHGMDIKETVNKLSYDLYYLKQRTLLLDLEILLKTIKTLLSRSGA